MKKRISKIEEKMNMANNQTKRPKTIFYLPDNGRSVRMEGDSHVVLYDPEKCISPTADMPILKN